ncbi:MAG: hypothetical protein H7196_04660 [candidate division SR1 bacterium]|nr:hypothetical protein [candidate division SR1 bacterium]
MTSRVDAVAKGTLGMLKLDTIELLKSIKVRALVVGGRSDIMTKVLASETMATNIPNATLIFLENTGHMGMLENTKVHIDYLDKFIK